MCVPLLAVAAGSFVLLISAMEGRGEKKQAVLNFFIFYYLGHKSSVLSSAVDNTGE